MRHCVAAATLILFASGCGEPERVTDDRDESSRFANVAANAAFVGDDACFDCHEDQYRGYQNHGMAQSLYRLTEENAVESYGEAEVRDDVNSLSYRPVREDGRFYQEEIRRDASGRVVHRLRREMDYVVGSGSAARTYLTEEDGRYYQLPLTWYTQTGRWDFSPGYEQANARFDRLIPDRCMTCHTSYPDPVPFADGKYHNVPEGIGCERCHGPGSIHVDARLASPEPGGGIDTTIVNPAHLSLDRGLDVCQQCHLHTTVSVLREGRTAYDFRPSQNLADYVAFFAAEQEGSEDAIDVISHADRMKQSPCFLETQQSEAPMDCVTCHDPHEGFRDAGPAYFNETCMSCHNAADLQQAFDTEENRTIHSATANCFSCHMPKVQAEGTPHASFTDHWIRVVEGEPDVSERVDVKPARLDPYFRQDEDADVYRGMAYVVYGRQRGDSSALRRGIDLLNAHATGETGFGEAQFLLGFAHMQLGSIREAIPALERAVTSGPDIPERLNALAQAYEADGRAATSIERLYRRALEIQPAVADIRTNYGRFLETQGRLEDAIAQYRRAVDEQAWLEEAHYNLGTAYLRAGDVAKAEEALKEAIHLDPDYVSALGNLGLLYAGQGRPHDARTLFERAVAAAPDNPVALGNLGAYHLNAGSLTEAIALLERSVAADAAYVDGLANLALAYLNAGDAARARTYAERALRLAPNHPTARQIMDAL